MKARRTGSAAQLDSCTRRQLPPKARREPMHHRKDRGSHGAARGSRVILHLIVAAIAGCSGSRQALGGSRPPSAPPLHQDTEFIEVNVRGSLPDLTFEFRDCSGKYEVIIRAIDFVRSNRAACTIQSDGWGIPTIWKYGSEGSGYELLRCEALTPGEYGVAVFGGWRGNAVLVIDEDGTARIENDLCEQHRSKQEPAR